MIFLKAKQAWSSSVKEMEALRNQYATHQPLVWDTEMKDTFATVRTWLCEVCGCVGVCMYVCVCVLVAVGVFVVYFLVGGTFVILVGGKQYLSVHTCIMYNNVLIMMIIS